MDQLFCGRTFGCEDIYNRDAILWSSEQGVEVSKN